MLLLLYVAILLLLLQLLLLAAAVHHRVPDGKKYVCWFIEPDPDVLFFSILTLFLMYPVASVVNRAKKGAIRLMRFNRLFFIFYRD